MANLPLVSVEERDVVYKGQIVKSSCLVFDFKMAAEDGLSGFVGEGFIVVGDIEVARRLQAKINV